MAAQNIAIKKQKFALSEQDLSRLGPIVTALQVVNNFGDNNGGLNQSAFELWRSRTGKNSLLAATMNGSLHLRISRSAINLVPQ